MKYKKLFNGLMIGSMQKKYRFALIAALAGLFLASYFASFQSDIKNTIPINDILKINTARAESVGGDGDNSGVGGGGIGGDGGTSGTGGDGGSGISTGSSSSVGGDGNGTPTSDSTSTDADSTASTAPTPAPTASPTPDPDPSPAPAPATMSAPSPSPTPAIAPTPAPAHTSGGGGGGSINSPGPSGASPSSIITFKKELMPLVYHASSISLKQIPYTGVGDNLKTFLFLLAIFLASGFGARFALAVLPETRPNISISSLKNYTLFKLRGGERQKPGYKFELGIHQIFPSW